MLTMILRRLAQTALVLIGVSLVTFLMMHFAPGQPLQNNPELRLDPTAVERWLELRNLDRPLPAQYLAWASRVVRGDLGQSLIYNRPVAELILERLPATVLLTGTSFIISFSLAVILGIYSVTKQGGLCDRIVSSISLAGVSVPSFWLGTVMIMLFSYRLQLLPSAGIYTPGVEGLYDVLLHMILPVTVIVWGSFAYYVRYVRFTIAGILSQEFIKAARARGIHRHKVLWRHVLPNAAIPFVTIAALSLPSLFTGASVVEFVFSWPGMGRWLISSTLARDYPVIMTANLLIATLVALANFSADTLYFLFDPRIRK